MKLYKNTTKRIAKKTLGRYWEKLQYGLTLKPGDLINTCTCKDEVIVKIHPEYRQFGKGKYIIDFAIITDSMLSCSLIHCCDPPRGIL